MVLGNAGPFLGIASQKLFVDHWDLGERQFALSVTYKATTPPYSIHVKFSNWKLSSN